MGTFIKHEEEFKYNAPHHFMVVEEESNEALVYVDFQKGPVKEVGLNGCQHEDLIKMILIRLENFQKSEYACEENAKAIEYLNKTLEIMESRTKNREARGVEGTSQI